MEPATRPPTLRFGPYLVDFRAGELHKSGSRIRLQEKPLRVLALLAERQGQLVTREELKQHLWPEDTFVEFEAGLNTAVSKLRDALSDNAGKPRYIETIPRRGYRFLAPVSFAEPQVHTREAHSNRTKEDRLTRSIAVLPFENRLGDPSHDYLSDGMMDALITALSKASSLRMISRTSVMQYKQACRPLPEIARQLGVKYIVEGSVLPMGNRLRITARLLDADRDQLLWADRFDGGFDEILSLVDNAAVSVASAVGRSVGEPESPPTKPKWRIAPEASQAYLRGRHEFYRFTGPGLSAAIEWYERAIKADPDFSLSYSALAHAYCAMVSPVDALPPRELFEKVESAARRAIELDPSNAEARFGLGLTELMFRWNWDAAHRETRLAVSLDPNNAPARVVMACCYLVIGENDRAVEETERGCTVDPWSPFMQASHHAVLYHARRFEEAKARMGMDRPRVAGFFKYHLVLGMCAIHDRDWEGAIHDLLIAVEASGGSPFTKACLGYALAGNGQQTEARRIFQELLRLSESRYVAAADLAILATGLGDTEAALDWLEKAYNERSTFMILFAHDAMLDPLHALPRFQNIVRRVGLPESLMGTRNRLDA